MAFVAAVSARQDPSALTMAGKLGHWWAGSPLHAPVPYGAFATVGGLGLILLHSPLVRRSVINLSLSAKNKVVLRQLRESSPNVAIDSAYI